jgi:hypothetical protein
MCGNHAGATVMSEIYGEPVSVYFVSVNQVTLQPTVIVYSWLSCD